jgi:hypothetical protein
MGLVHLKFHVPEFHNLRIYEYFFEIFVKITQLIRLASQKIDMKCPKRIFQPKTNQL